MRRVGSTIDLTHAITKAGSQRLLAAAGPTQVFSVRALLVNAGGYLCRDLWIRRGDVIRRRSHVESDQLGVDAPQCALTHRGRKRLSVLWNIRRNRLQERTEEQRPSPEREPFLHQNYPNPFSTGTTIRYEISAKSRVRVKILNLLGQTVATLRDEGAGPGIYESHWRAAYPSGMVTTQRKEVEV